MAVHAPFYEDIDDASILAKGPMPLCTHSAVGQNLRDGVFGC